jgi:uncharacterized phage protein gp47/JayE
MADYQNRLDRLIKAIEQRTGLSNVIPGTKSYQILQSIAYEQLQVELLLEKDSTDNSLLNSTGDKLATIGSFFGIEKRLALPTEVTSTMKSLKFYVSSGKFGDINNGNSILIPQGTMVEGTLSDGTLVRLATTVQITLSKNDSECFISAELIQGKTDVLPINTINRHYFTNYAQSTTGALLITNPTMLSTGRPDETDQNYRYRLFNGQRSFATTNTAGIFNVASGVPGVSYVDIVPSYNGGGTFAIYVQSINPITPDTLINEVHDIISTIVPPWAEYKVLKPNYVGLQLDLTMTMKNPELYTSNTAFIALVQSRISSYVNNFLDNTFYILDIIRMIEGINNDVLSISFNLVNKYLGTESFRYPISIPVSNGENQTIILAAQEKLVIEPIANPITIRIK